MNVWQHPRIVSPERHLERMAASLQAWQRLLGAGAAGGAVLELDQVVGSIVPSAPSRSMLNAAVGPRGMRWERPILRRLTERYDAAGIKVWGIWAHEDDRRGLDDSALIIDSSPAAMALELSRLPAAPLAEGLTVERTADLGTLAAPLSAGYGFPPELLTNGVPGLLDMAHGYVAHLAGRPAAGLLIVDCNGDAGVFMVASVPELRGRGAASGALHRALTEARARGCTTSTLQSSAMGHSVYRRLGYRDLGRYMLWERRAQAPEATSRG